MRLFRGKIPIIAAEITRNLLEDKDIESEMPDEVDLDIQAVLKEYLRTEDEIVEQAKDFLEKKGMTYSNFSKIKKQIADHRGFGVGEEALDYIMNQILMSFMHSVHVDEVFSEDHELKRKMRIVLRKHMEIEEELDQETRAHLKNLDEGTRTWEVEYSKVMSQIKRKRGLD